MEKVDVSKVAKFARITLKDEEKTKYQAYLDEMIDWFNKMLENPALVRQGNEVYTVIEAGERLLEDDTPQNPKNREEVLQNVPNKHDGFILVPKLLDE